MMSRENSAYRGNLNRKNHGSEAYISEKRLSSHNKNKMLLRNTEARPPENKTSRQETKRVSIRISREKQTAQCLIGPPQTHTYDKDSKKRLTKIENNNRYPKFSQEITYLNRTKNESNAFICENRSRSHHKNQTLLRNIETRPPKTKISEYDTKKLNIRDPKQSKTYQKVSSQRFSKIDSSRKLHSSHMERYPTHQPRQLLEHNPSAYVYEHAIRLNSQSRQISNPIYVNGQGDNLQHSKFDNHEDDIDSYAYRFKKLYIDDEIAGPSKTVQLPSFKAEKHIKINTANNITVKKSKSFSQRESLTIVKRKNQYRSRSTRKELNFKSLFRKTSTKTSSKQFPINNKTLSKDDTYLQNDKSHGNGVKTKEDLEILYARDEDLIDNEKEDKRKNEIFGLPMNDCMTHQVYFMNKKRKNVKLQHKTILISEPTNTWYAEDNDFPSKKDSIVTTNEDNFKLVIFPSKTCACFKKGNHERIAFARAKVPRVWDSKSAQTLKHSVLCKRKSQNLNSGDCDAATRDSKATRDGKNKRETDNSKIKLCIVEEDKGSEKTFRKVVKSAMTSCLRYFLIGLLGLIWLPFICVGYLCGKLLDRTIKPVNPCTCKAILKKVRKNVHCIMKPRKKIVKCENKIQPRVKTKEECIIMNIRNKGYMNMIQGKDSDIRKISQSPKQTNDSLANPNTDRLPKGIPSMFTQRSGEQEKSQKSDEKSQSRPRTPKHAQSQSRTRTPEQHQSLSRPGTSDKTDRERSRSGPSGVIKFTEIRSRPGTSPKTYQAHSILGPSKTNVTLREIRSRPGILHKTDETRSGLGPSKTISLREIKSKMPERQQDANINIEDTKDAPSERTRRRSAEYQVCVCRSRTSSGLGGSKSLSKMTSGNKKEQSETTEGREARSKTPKCLESDKEILKTPEFTSRKSPSLKYRTPRPESPRSPTYVTMGHDYDTEQNVYTTIHKKSPIGAHHPCSYSSSPRRHKSGDSHISRKHKESPDKTVECRRTHHDYDYRDYRKHGEREERRKHDSRDNRDRKREGYKRHRHREKSHHDKSHRDRRHRSRSHHDRGHRSRSHHDKSHHDRSHRDRSRRRRSHGDRERRKPRHDDYAREKRKRKKLRKRRKQEELRRQEEKRTKREAKKKRGRRKKNEAVQFSRRLSDAAQQSPYKRRTLFQTLGGHCDCINKNLKRVRQRIQTHVGPGHKTITPSTHLIKPKGHSKPFMPCDRYHLKNLNPRPTERSRFAPYSAKKICECISGNTKCVCKRITGAVTGKSYKPPCQPCDVKRVKLVPKDRPPLKMVEKHVVHIGQKTVPIPCGPRCLRKRRRRGQMQGAPMCRCLRALQRRKPSAWVRVRRKWKRFACCVLSFETFVWGPMWDCNHCNKMPCRDQKHCKDCPRRICLFTMICTLYRQCMHALLYLLAVCIWFPWIVFFYLAIRGMCRCMQD